MPNGGGRETSPPSPPPAAASSNAPWTVSRDGRVMAPKPTRQRTFKFSSADDLKAVGFTRAQAEGVIIARNQSTSLRSTCSALDTEAYSASDLREAGFTPDQLQAAGFSASVLLEAGFEPEDLASSTDATSIAELKAAGYSAVELRETGYSLKQLRAAGFSVDVLRREARLSVAELRAAGFSAGQLKEAGFSPGDLKEAGYGLAAIKKAGYTPQQLCRKSGFSLEELKDAGMSAADLRKGGFSPPQLLEVGYQQSDVQKAGFTHAELEGKPAAGASASSVDVLAAAKTLRQQQQQQQRRPRPMSSDRVRSGSAAGAGGAPEDAPPPSLSALLYRPPATEVLGPSGRHYHGASLLRCLRPGVEPRRTAIFLVESRCFEPLILTTILLNVLVMASDSPLDLKDTPKAAFIARCVPPPPSPTARLHSTSSPQPPLYRMPPLHSPPLHATSLPISIQVYTRRLKHAPVRRQERAALPHSLHV